MIWRIEGHDGQQYENSYVWVMKLADGRVVDGTAFYDSISFNELWARVKAAVSGSMIVGRYVASCRSAHRRSAH
jgi:hypothetical protein